MRRRHLFRRVLLVPVGLLLALAAFEVVLQGLAYAVWARAVTPVSRPDAAHVVLCVGDSFTFGLGGDGPGDAYPAVAQRLCRADGLDVAFVNRGVAGQTSRDVLLGLEAALRCDRPELVCVLVGTNDLWERPAAVTAAELETSREHFPWRWRTLRMAKLAAAWLAQPHRRESAPAFVGTWHDGNRTAWFGDHGGFWLDGLSMHWELDDGELCLVSPEGWRQGVEWSVRGDRLRFRPKSWQAARPVRRGRAPAAAAAASAGLGFERELADVERTRRQRSVVAAEEVLRSHLVEIARRCRRHGARPVFLSYAGGPFAKAPAQCALRDVARGQQVDFLDVRAAFDEAVRGGQVRSALYVADGHFSSRGYALLGALVARRVKAARRAR